MNPIITKAINMLPKEMEQTKEESDTEWFLAYGYNQALNDCKQSLPLIFKMILEEVKKIVDVSEDEIVNVMEKAIRNKILQDLTLLNSDK